MFAFVFVLATFVTAVERLAVAAPNGNVGEVRAVREELLAMEPDARVRYSIAYANRVLAFGPGTDKDQRRELLREAVAQLEQIENKDAEAYALLGSVQGALIGSEPQRASELGPKARLALARAESLAPHNPRVHLLLGISAFNRPPEFGGGADKAEVHLRKAVALFKNEPPSKPWPNWGRYDAHLWLGQALQKLGRKDEALDEYRAALAIAPDSEYVRRILKR